VPCVLVSPGPSPVVRPPFCPPFVFITLRIAFPASPMFSQRSALPGGCARCDLSDPTSVPSVLCLFRPNRCVSHCYGLFVSIRKITSFVFKQIRTLSQNAGVWHPPVFLEDTGGGGPRVSSGSLMPAVASTGPRQNRSTGAKLPLPALGAIIPLCTPRVRRLALATHHSRHSPASRDRFSWG
jgi:hypothetical protein